MKEADRARPRSYSDASITASDLLPILAPAIAVAIVAIAVTTFLSARTGEVFSIAIFVAGFAVGTISSAVPLIFVRGRSQGSRFVTVFAEVEQLMRHVVAGNDPSPAKLDPSRLTKELICSGVWSDQDASKFRYILELRNQVVHSSEPAPDADALRSAVRSLRELEHRLTEANLDLNRLPSDRSALEYEQDVRQAIERSGFEVPVGRLGRDEGIDFQVANQPLGIVVKYRTKRPLMRSEVAALRPVMRCVVVTNSDLTIDMLEWNEQAGSEGRGIEVVQWVDADDDDILLRAMLRAFGSLSPPP